MTIPSQIRGLADIEEIEKVPFQERVQFRSTYEMLRYGATIDPHKVAIYFILSGDAYQYPMEITYDQLLGRVHQAANLFHNAGIGSEDVVAIVLPNLPQIHYAIWGGEAAGIICMVNPMLGADHIRDILRTSRAKVLVTLGPNPLTDVWERISSIRADLPDLKTIFQVMGQSEGQEGVYSFDEELGQHNAAGFDFQRVIEPSDVAAMFHTGGTTGAPKLAQHTHLNEIHDTWCMNVMSGLTRDDPIMCGLPLFHVNGVFVTGLAAFAKGSSVVLLSPQGYRDQGVIRNFYKIVEHYRAATFSGVPTLYSALLQMPIGDADVSSLKYGVCGAAAMPVDVFKEFEKRTGIKILEGYGLTEGTCASAINPRDGERKIGSIGIRFPYQQMKTVIVDSEGNYVRDCEPGEIGLVVINGLIAFKGYLQPEHTARAWVADGWVNTGDLGRMDEDGYFWLTGRAKDLIIRGGHNIDPAAIEDALYKHPSVHLAAAVGRPDAYAGEVPVAYVTLRPGTSATEEELLTHCKSNIREQAAIPKEVAIVESMPVTLVGKIFKPELRWDATTRVFTRELAAIGDLVEKFEVITGEDKVHGTMARIAIWPKTGVANSDVEERIRQVLGRYTVRYTVDFQN